MAEPRLALDPFAPRVGAFPFLLTNHNVTKDLISTTKRGRNAPFKSTDSFIAGTTLSQEPAVPPIPSLFSE